MKHTLFIAAAFCLLTANVFGQTFKVESSKPYEERLGVPVLIMKNGYTVCSFDDVREKKLILKVFDEKRKLIVSKPVNFKTLEKDFLKRHYAKMDVTIEIVSWKEDNGKIILGLLDDHFEGKYNNVMKYDVRINPLTGDVEAENQASENSGFNYSITSEKNTGNYFVSDYKLKQKGEERGKLTFGYYDVTGKKLGEIPFDYLDNTQTKADVFSWKSIGNKKAAALIYVSKDKKEPKMIFSIFDFGTNKQTNKTVFDVPDDFDIESISMSLVPGKDLINVLYYIKTGAKSGKIYYQLMYQNIDYVKMEIYKPFAPTYDKLDEYVVNKCKIKKGYEGGFIYSSKIDEKGNIFSTRVRNVTSIYGQNVTTMNPEFVGITYCDIYGKELNAWAFSYNTAGSSARGSLVTSALNDFSFKTISNKKGNFLILNDLEKNMDLLPHEKASFARITDESNSMVVWFTEDGRVKKEFLFGKPATKKENKYADLRNALYDEATNSLVTIYYEGEGYKNNRLAWINLD